MKNCIKFNELNNWSLAQAYLVQCNAREKKASMELSTLYFIAIRKKEIRKETKE